MRPTKLCAYCGKEFAKPLTCSLKDWNTQRKYCSYACYGNSKRKVPPDKELLPLLEHLYLEEEQTVEKIANDLGVHPSSLLEHMDRLGIERRKVHDYKLPPHVPQPKPPCEICGKPVKLHSRRFCSKECKDIGISGPDSPLYKGGFSHCYGIFWQYQTKKIRERDKVCQRCGKTPEENGRALDVHHIVPYRISFDHSLSNLIAYCISCHAIVEHETQPLYPDEAPATAQIPLPL